MWHISGVNEPSNDLGKRGMIGNVAIVGRLREVDFFFPIEDKLVLFHNK